MLQRENILISVECEYVLKMLGGRKTAEVRRRCLRIHPGTRVWIYSKLPRGRVEAVAIADEVIAASPRKLWGLYRDRISIPNSDFKAYLQGVDIACVVLLSNITRLEPALDLRALRRNSNGFQPPQFFKRLFAHGPELKTLTSSFASA